MCALELNQKELRFRTDYPQPRPKPGEVLVRLSRAGICETDLQLVQGYMDFNGVLGHEFVGVAESGHYAGKRVVGEINCRCRKCEYCLPGLGNHCPNRTVLGILNHDGAFAEYIAVPEANLHRVPDGIDDDTAVFTEPLAAALRITQQLPLSTNERVVVLGDGRLGNLCSQVLSGIGCTVTTIGKHAEKLALLDGLGIETGLVGDTPPERLADLVVDCTGSPTGLPAALQWVKPCGVVVLKTTVAQDLTMSTAPIVIDEVAVIGSRCGPFDLALEALCSDRVEVAGLISARYPFAEATAAMKHAGEPGVLKVLLDFDVPSAT